MDMGLDQGSSTTLVLNDHYFFLNMPMLSNQNYYRVSYQCANQNFTEHDFILWRKAGFTNAHTLIPYSEYDLKWPVAMWSHSPCVCALAHALCTHTCTWMQAATNPLFDCPGQLKILLDNQKFKVLCPNGHLKSKLKFCNYFWYFNRCVWHFISKQVEGDSFKGVLNLLPKISMFCALS